MAATAFPTRRAGRPGRPRSADADKAILRAALKLFAERGLEGAGIEQIAHRAGVARTTVYRRWSSRESLIAEAIAQGRGAAEQEAMASGASPKATVEAVVASLVETFSARDYRTILARLIGSVPEQPQLMSIYWRTFLLPRRKAAAAVLERARAQGAIRHDADTEILLDLISGAAMHRLLVYPGGGSKAELRSYLLELFAELGLGRAQREAPRRQRRDLPLPKP